MMNLDAFRQIGDPPADLAIERLVAQTGPEEARHLFDRLVRQIEMPLDELPDSLRDYWAATDRLPGQVDPEQMRLASAFFADHGPKFLIFLYFKSLPLLYTCANGAKVLVQTGRLTSRDTTADVFTRRIAETGQFLLTVMAPDALLPGGPGIRAIQKVRLIHAAIRFFIRQRGEWKQEEWGVPVNQEDMAATLMTFSVALTEALDQFGVAEQAVRREAYCYCWTAIGRLLGLREELLPANEAAGQALLQAVLRRQSAASEEGRMLTEALTGFIRSNFPREVQLAPEALMQHLLGPERLHLLGLQTPAGCLGIALPALIGNLFRLGERLEDRLQQPLAPFIETFSRHMMLRMVQYFDEHKQRRLALPEAFRQRWVPDAPL